jgi:hypothetical protein
LLILTSALIVALSACAGKSGIGEIPDDPVERAAVLGIANSYLESTMWEFRDARVLGVTPMVPTKSFVQQHDPKELYCVCIAYEARYKVPWTTKDKSDWKESVRNVLVMKTRGDHFLALRPQGICPAFCQ